MTLSYRSASKVSRATVRFLVIFIIASLAVTLSPVRAEVAGVYARQAMGELLALSKEINHRAVRGQDFSAEKVDDPSRNADRVTRFRLCPRRLVLYVGEGYTLVPLPLDGNKEVVNGAALQWSTNEPSVATVSSWGEVEAIAPGHTVATVQAGTGRATVAVEVRQGARPVQRDLEWDIEHSGDCGDPESSEPQSVGSTQEPPELTQAFTQSATGQLHSVAGDRSRSDYVRDDDVSEEPLNRDNASRRLPAEDSATLEENGGGRDTLRRLARRAAFRVTRSTNNGATRNASQKIPLGRLFPLIDPDGGDTTSPSAAKFNNAVGSPRFTAQDVSPTGSSKTRRQLGSYNYNFTAPVLGLGGRGNGVGLALSYNSRLWNKDNIGVNGQMTFNYNKGWPAAGWTLGYGRIIKNYDNTATGDGTGVGQFNHPGNRLLIQSDGTRVHLEQVYDSVGGTWDWDTTDGSFYHLSRNGKLKGPDGSIVKYDEPNNRLVPTSIKNRNGELITIAYRTKDVNFPYRWAIDFITDSLGRVVQFKYYGDTGYPADPANGKPDDALAAVLAPNFGGSGTRTLVQIDYQDITLKYDFGSMAVVSPGNNSILTVVRRIYSPQTGQGYLFQDFSTYGMARKISTRKDMTGAGGTITDGTEISYTKHDYTTIDPFDPYGRNQSGALNDSPQYLKRSEWWQGKTDDSGLPDSNPTDYSYSRTTGTGTETDTATYPSVLGGQLTVITTTDTNTGFVSQVEYKNGASTLSKTLYTYVAGPDGGTQIASVETFDEANVSTRVDYSYESYGRVKNVYEEGYKNNGTFVTRRRTRYDYSNLQAHLDGGLLGLVTEVRIYDGLLDNDNTNDVLKTDTVYSYDDYAIKGGMEYYGLTSAGYPPNHDAAFNQNYTTRGNVTGVQTFSSISPAVSTTRYTKWDIFGNVTQADVSCCQVKNFTFNSSNYWSQAVSVTSGTAGIVPFLTANYQYDFNTGLVKQTTDPNNLTTTFAYDSAWRLQTITAPSGAVTTTQSDRDSNGNDQLAYSQQVSYLENGSTKVITSKSWFDGAGRVLRSGSGAGSAPVSYDTVATVYDRFGRVLKQSNPYAGDSSGNGSPSYWTSNSYDLLSRVTQVKLPDNQTITTSYAGAALPTGATVMVTDQVGRQRKSEADGLGRLVKVTEQDPATGGLTWPTTYAYDVLDNLTSANQNNQTRTFSYDALSRLTSQATPEAGAVSLTYKDFGAVQKRTDARGVETHYKYDSLNRPLQVWYTGPGGDDNGSIRPALPSGVAATSDVTIAYNNFSSPQVGNGQVNQVTDGGGTESYVYDSVSRQSSKTRVIDARSYQTQYLYNTASQLTTLIYPSGKRVRTNHDSRGRTSGLDRVDSLGNVLANYVTSVGYSTASQVTGVSLANGVNETYGYSSDRLQLTSQTATKGASTLMSLTYGYSASAGASGAGTTAGNSGQLISMSGTINGLSRSQAFTYDNVGRLLTASGWSSWNRRFAYDRWGNRTGMWDALSGGNQLQNIAIALTGGVANNRISNVNGVPYTYDATGSCTWDGAHSYAYDGEGRQSNVDSGVTSSGAYDSANRRLKKIAGGVTTHYVWEGAQVIAEYNGSTGALISEYIYAGSRMLARDQGGVLRYYHQDRLSTRLITDGSGTMMGTEDHLPFGEDAGTTGETEKHRFTTYERDSESGTDQAINRQHQFSNGRFLQPDPIAGSALYPQSMNRYSYTSNDPVNSADPLGLVEQGLWRLWLGGFRLGGTGLTLDGADVPQYMLGYVAHLWMSGGANILPPSAIVGGRGQIVVDDVLIADSNPNDYWRSLPGSLMPVSWRVDFSCEKYFTSSDVKVIYDTFKNKVAELTRRGLRTNNSYWNNISATLNMVSPLGHAYLGCGQQAGRIIEALNGVKENGLLTNQWKFEFEGLPLDLHVWAKATSSNRKDPVIRLDPWKNRITCNAHSQPMGGLTLF